MSVRDSEVIELLGDRPELLAIADAVSATHDRHTGRASRRRVAGVVAVAAAVALGIAAILVVPQGRQKVVDRAFAALGAGPVTHVVAEGPTGSVLVDLETGARTVEHARLEIWADQPLDRLHLLLTVHGRTAAEFLWPQDKGNGITLRSFHPAFAALWSGYRAALKDGTATVARTGSVGGHAVYWLRFAGTPKTEVAVDAHTYKPIVYRVYTGSRHHDQRILVAQAIGYDQADFTRRGPSPVGRESSGVVGSGSGSTVVKAPWLTAGKTVAGLRLGAVDPLVVTRTVGGRPTTLEGIELVYGPLNSMGTATAGSTTIDELPRPEFPEAWKDRPAGSIEIVTGGSSGPGSTRELWVGSLEKHGLYITIRTPVSERALLAIARSLHPAR